MKRRHANTIIANYLITVDHGRIVYRPGQRVNASPIDPRHPLAPKHHPLTPAEKTHKHGPVLTVAVKCVHDANAGLAAAGHMTYTENWRLRQELFGRHPLDFADADADCSQFVASILHWNGVPGVTSTDYTGTLLQKGRLIAHPVPGCAAIWGPRTGAHTAFMTRKTPDGKDWYCVGFGHQGAPDRNTLSAMNAYFAGVGQPGVRFLEFAA